MPAFPGAERPFDNRAGNAGPASRPLRLRVWASLRDKFQLPSYWPSVWRTIAESGAWGARVR